MRDRGRQLGADVGQAEPVCDVGDDRGEVERDLAAVDHVRRPVAFDDRDERLVSGAVGVLPDFLDTRAGEGTLGGGGG